MEIFSVLPHIQVALNITAISLLCLGYYFISQNNRNAHKFCMLSAIAVSMLFLTCYLYYHAHVGHVPFAGHGFIRPVYFTILISHLILATCIIPLVIISLYFAIKKNFSSHKRITRWLFPIWIYVSLTGIIVYLLVFNFYPAKI